MVSRNYLVAIICVVLAMLTVQSGASLAKDLFDSVGAEGAITYRIGFSAIILWLVFKPWKSRPNAVYPLIIYGLCLGGMNTAFYFSIERIPIGVAVALEFIGPLTLAILSSTKKVDLFWVLIALGGISLLLPEIFTARVLDPVGILLALLAGAFWAIYIVIGKKSGQCRQSQHLLRIY